LASYLIAQRNGSSENEQARGDTLREKTVNNYLKYNATFIARYMFGLLRPYYKTAYLEE